MDSKLPRTWKVALLASVVGGTIGLLGTLGGAWIDRIASDAKTSVEASVRMIDLAIGILSHDPGADPTETELALRRWAVDVLAVNAERQGVPFDAAARQALETRSLKYVPYSPVAPGAESWQYAPSVSPAPLAPEAAPAN